MERATRGARRNRGEIPPTAPRTAHRHFSTTRLRRSGRNDGNLPRPCPGRMREETPAAAAPGSQRLNGKLRQSSARHRPAFPTPPGGGGACLVVIIGLSAVYIPAPARSAATQQPEPGLRRGRPAQSAGAAGRRRSKPASGRNSPRQDRPIALPAAQGPVESSARLLGERNGNRKRRADDGADDRKHDEGIHDARSRRCSRYRRIALPGVGRRCGDTNPAGFGTIASCLRYRRHLIGFGIIFS